MPDFTGNKKNRITNTFSSSPIFRKMLKDYAESTGVSFSEAIRTLVTIALKVQMDTGIRKQLETFTERDRAVQAEYKRQNQEAYLNNAVEVPKNRFVQQNERIERLEERLGLVPMREDEPSQVFAGENPINTDCSIYANQDKKRK